MIIGLEWIAIILLLVSFVLLFAVGLIVHSSAETVATVLEVLALICGISIAVLVIGLSSAQNIVEEHYIDYIELQTKVARYDDLDVLEQYKVSTDVATYNLWYERNKSDLENEWTFKGTSDYAKEFDYIVIGG